MFGSFPLALLYELTRQAKAANRDANIAYSEAIGWPQESDVWAECQKSARLCDLADDLTIECEDAEFDRARAA